MPVAAEPGQASGVLPECRLPLEEALHQRSCLSKVSFAGQADCLPHVSRHQWIDGGHNIGLSCAWATSAAEGHVTSC